MYRELIDWVKEIAGTTRGPLARLAKNSSLLIGGGVVTSLITTGQAILLARYLGTQGYGYLALALAPALIAYQVVDFRTWEITIRFLPERLAARDDGQALDILSALISLDIVSGLAACAIIAMGASLIVQLGGLGPSNVGLVWLAALAVPGTLVAAGVPIGVLRVFDRFGLITAKFAALAAAELALVGGVVWSGLGLREVLAVYVGMRLADAAVGIVLAARQLHVSPARLLLPKPRSAWKNIKPVLGFAGQSWLSGTIKGASGQLDIFLLGYLASPAAVGMYRLALEIATLISKVGNPVQSAILPVFVDQAASKDTETSRRIALTATAFLSTIVMPVVLALSAFAPLVVKLAGGTSFAGAALALTLLSMGYGANTILIWARPLLVAQGRIALGNSTAILGVALGLGVMWTLAPAYGAAGAAAACASRMGFDSLVMAVSGLLFRPAPKESRGRPAPRIP